MALLPFLSLFFLSFIPLALSVPVTNGGKNLASASCFPALRFKTPSHVPNSLNHWWCDPDTEYAFVGFSYEVTACEATEVVSRCYLS